MKTEKNILIAFILNLSFSVFEFFGGILTSSVAIISDSVHDLGDAVSIGLSYFLERKSKKRADPTHTYGYLRYSVLGGIITSLILIIGSVFVTYNAILRLIEPVQINYNGMIIFAIVGAAVNFIAAIYTHKGDSINQRAVNLHMLEDVLNWILVLIGAVIMKFTDIVWLDPVLCIAVSVFIFVSAIKNLKTILNIFLDKTPNTLSQNKLEQAILELDGVYEVRNIFLHSLDGYRHAAAIHVAAEKSAKLREQIRDILLKFSITHVTIEIEDNNEPHYQPRHISDHEPHTHTHTHTHHSH